MNLETFKARARRKLELPHGSTQSAGARIADTPSADIKASSPEAAALASPQATPQVKDQKPETMTPLEPGAAGHSKSPDSSTDKSAAALSEARNLEAERSATTSKFASSSADDLRVDRRSSPTGRHSLQSLTGSPSQPTAPNTAGTSEKSANQEELQRLRSLLLGDDYKTQQEQVEVIYQRTQASVNGLRRDLDAKLDDLSQYLGQLERSILHSVEDRTDSLEHRSRATIIEGTELRLQKHNDRLDALDVRLSNTLTNLQTEVDANREADRAFLKSELADASARTDKLLVGVVTRLDASIKSIEERLTTSPQSQSAGLVASSEATVGNLRTQLGNLIDERVRTFNDQQSAGLLELRDTLLDNTKEINSSLQAQTEHLQKTLSSHRTELEKQFNEAIAALTKSTVSHKDLSQLLARLADRIKLPN